MSIMTWALKHLEASFWQASRCQSIFLAPASGDTQWFILLSYGGCRESNSLLPWVHPLADLRS